MANKHYDTAMILYDRILEINSEFTKSYNKKGTIKFIKSHDIQNLQ